MTSSPARTDSGGVEGRPLRADAARNIEQVLASAPTVLADDPAASMEVIAERAGIARATLYRHFETREELIIAIYGRALEETRKHILGADPDGGSAIEALERVIAAVLEVGDRYRFLAQSHPDTPSLREAEQAVGDVLIALFDRGRREGAFREEIPGRLMAGYFGAVVQTAIRIVDDGHAALEEAATLSLTMLIDGIARRDR